ncbi:MAG: adenylyltransferase/cytidyltransferase family protein [Planctomycetota bacterium]|nr:adenylyltransferase/cytidyltransferase family protein [Planctomycetota bacterium]
MAEIVHDRSKLRAIIEEAQRAGKTVVFANGCFDIIHAGHIRYIRGARLLGDILVVGVNSDESVRQLKGTDRPVMPLEERLEVLSEFRSIDYLIPFAETRADSLLAALKPDIHAKGTDYTQTTVPERDTVLSFGGRIAIVGDPKNHSVTDIIKRLKKGK